MPGSGIWLDDDTYSQTAGQMWAQQATQQVHAGESWAQQAMQAAIAPIQDTLGKLQSMVPSVPQPAAAAPAPAPPPVVPTPAPTPLPEPTPAPTPPLGVAQTPVAEPTPAAPPGAPTPTPTPSPLPTPPEVPTPSPSPALTDMASTGENWAQQQIQNLLNPAQATPQTPSTPAATALPIPGLNTSAAAPTPTPAPAAPTPATATPTPAAGPTGDMPNVQVDSSSPEAFVRSVAPAAQWVQDKTGIPAAAMIGMAANETGYGKSAPGNNLFGIKGQGPAGATTSGTWEDYGNGPVQITDQFRRYDNATQSFQDFVDFLRDNPRYQGVMNLVDQGKANVGNFVQGLKDAGYMTDPNYVGKIQSIVDQYQPVIDQARGAVSGVQGAAQNAVSAVTGRGGDPGMGAPVNTPAQGRQAAAAVEPQRQFEQEAGLSTSDAYTACGPVAAAAFAATYGRNPTPSEAIALARQVGWDPSTGMAGPQSEVNLLNKMGVDAHLAQGVNWSDVASSAQSGNPVIVSTPNHYLYVDGYNSDTGQYHVGASGQALRGGSDWMTPDQIAQVPGTHGAATAAIFVDHPIDGTQRATPPASALTMGANQPASSSPDLGSQLLQTGGSALNVLGSAAPDLGAGYLLKTGQDLATGLLQSPEVQSKAQNVAQAVLNVGGPPTQAVGQTGQNLLGQAQSILSPYAADISAAPQSVSDMLSQNALVSQGIPTVQGALSAVPDLSAQGIAGVGDWWQQQNALADQLQGQGRLGLQAGPPLDITKPLGPQLGFDPYGQIVQQGIPQLVSGVQQGNVGDILGGALQTGLGVLGGAAGPGGAATEAGRAALAAAPELARLGPEAGALGVPWSPQSLGLLQQGPREALPAILRPLDISGVPWSDQSLALLQQGPAATELAPAAYSPRGVLLDPLTGQEMVPRAAAQQANSYAAAQAANPEATQFVRTAGNQFEPVVSAAPQEAGDVLTGLRNLLAARQGTGDIIGGAQPGAINAAFARALGGGAAGGLGTYEATDPNDPNRWLKVAGGTAAGALLAGPGVDLATARPGGVATADWLRAAYRGGIIGGFNTAADVVFNSTLTPVLSGGAGLIRDLASFQPGRIQGRVLGAQSGIVNWTGNFLRGLSTSLAAPGTVSARAAPGLPTVVARALEGMGALHGAFQNATSQLIQSMEHGAESGANASAAGLSGPAWFTEFQRQFSGPVSARVQAMGDRTALRGDLGTLTSAFGRFVNQAGPVGDALFPVYRMGMAMAARMVESTPLGLAGTAFDVGRGLLGRGPYAAGLGTTPAGSAVGPLTERLTNNLVGTALSMWLANKAVGGAITGAGPSDPGQRQVWLADGNQPNSFLGPDGAYHSWQKLPPALRGPMMTAGAYADAVQAYNAATARQQTAGPEAYGVQDPRVAAAAQLVSEVGQQLASATPMRTFANLYDALQSNSVAGVGMTSAGDVASSVLGGLVPFSGEVRSIAQMTDPTQRQALTPRMPQELPQSVLENVAQNIPGLRENLPARVDMLGRPVSNPLQGLGELLPVRTAAGQPTPVLQAMQNVGVAPGPTPQTIPYGPYDEVRLTPQEQRTYDQYRGQLTQQMADGMVSSPQWQQMAQNAQRAALQRVDAVAADAAGKMVLRDIASGPGAGLSRMQPTGVMAPVVGYGPDVTGNQLMLQQQLLRNAYQHQALMQSLLGGQTGLQGLQAANAAAAGVV
jgi:flagellar protein FlgJ